MRCCTLKLCNNKFTNGFKYYKIRNNNNKLLDTVKHEPVSFPVTLSVINSVIIVS